MKTRATGEMDNSLENGLRWKTGRKTKTNQLRIRMEPQERLALEEQFMRDRESGQPHAKTLSSWLRHQIALVVGSQTRVVCALSKERYALLAELAKTMNREPEKIVDACIGGIAEMIANPHRKVPLIVAEFRLRQNYLRSTENLTPPH